jgi:hypothetical protein
MLYCARESLLRQPDEKGYSARAHLMGKAKRGSEKSRAAARADLTLPPLPARAAYLWEWFEELDRARSAGMHGTDGLSYPMIDAWARLTRREPTAEEIETLLLMDMAWRSPAAYLKRLAANG